MSRKRKDESDEVEVETSEDEDSLASETPAEEAVPAADEAEPAALEAPEGEEASLAEEATEASAEEGGAAPVKKGPTAGIQPGQYIYRGNLKVRVLAVVDDNTIRGVVANSGKILTITL